MLPASTAHANAYFLNFFSSLRQLNSYQLKSLYSTRLTCPFGVVGLLSTRYNLFFQVRKDCVHCKGTIKDNDILIGLCKAPLHFSCSKRSIAHIEQVKDEPHAKFGEKARVGLEKSAAKREGCVGRSPRFGLGVDLRTLRACSRVYRDLRVEHHTQLICFSSAPGV